MVQLISYIVIFICSRHVPLLMNSFKASIAFSQLSIHTEFGSMLVQARDGFFLNLSSVMLKLCEPFISMAERPSKVLKVNSLYCAVGSTIQDIEKPDTRVHLVQDTQESKVAQRTEDSEFESKNIGDSSSSLNLLIFVFITFVKYKVRMSSDSNFL